MTAFKLVLLFLATVVAGHVDAGRQEHGRHLLTDCTDAGCVTKAKSWALTLNCNPDASGCSFNPDTQCACATTKDSCPVGSCQCKANLKLSCPGSDIACKIDISGSGQYYNIPDGDNCLEPLGVYCLKQEWTDYGSVIKFYSDTGCKTEITAAKYSAITRATTKSGTFTCLDGQNAGTKGLSHISVCYNLPPPPPPCTYTCDPEVKNPKCECNYVAPTCNEGLELKCVKTEGFKTAGKCNQDWVKGTCATTPTCV